MKIKEGNSVEVLRRRKDPCGSWFPGKIISVNGDNYIVRYEFIRDHEGVPVVEKVHVEDVRPHPPHVKGEIWMLGDIAEVFDIHSWRAGKVAKVIHNNRFVIKLFGSIQLKEFQKSSLRIRQAWKDNKWSIVGKVGGNKQIDNNLKRSSSKYSRGLGCGDKQQCIHKEPHKRERNGQEHLEGEGQEHFKMLPPVRILKQDSGCFFESSPNNAAVGGGGKKRKATIKVERFERPPMKTLPLPKQVNAVSSPKVKMGEKCMDGSSGMDAKTDKTSNYSSLPSSVPVWVTEESNEFSVSCGSNDFPIYTAHKSLKSSKNVAASSFHNAESSCPSLSGRKDFLSSSRADLEADIHKLELHAYKSTMQALYASGQLSWEQESLLTNLRISLHISNEEHLLQLRHLLSAQVL
ncbi:hypothetical protein HHK36_026809 [Tetracentron sinense]|uniref:ENT domain-containing protein n=1 Tax=Tetracentron sinense TaxID=13715 RepID=A0A835D2H3_TETSI|nr:hypothetical protein HHK36_026809 [Tetracentron sinense]